ncbi:MAG TPA: hypothetical protein PK857_09085 [Hyphomicrobium sp.]|nr:hypothetical protein [Hyphomicrobium sp.]HRO50434.1 hypothetical protein [Hyphomicrobium sp.]
MLRRSLPFLMLAVGLAGCSGGGGVSTASILGSEAAPTTPAGQASVAADPGERAFHAGAVTARATRCGYNFDPGMVRSNYLAHEAALGAMPEQMAKLQQTYDVAHNGVAKAAGEDPNYCTDRRTREIKTELGRLLEGNFEAPKKQVVKEEGLFSGWLDGGGSDSGPSFGSSDWWEKQKDAAGQ